MNLVKEADKDNMHIQKFANKMKGKMANSRHKGRHGWDLSSCSSDTLAQQFVEHLDKTNTDNFVDLANYLMMLDQKGADPAIIKKYLED